MKKIAVGMFLSLAIAVFLGLSSGLFLSTLLGFLVVLPSLVFLLSAFTKYLSSRTEKSLELRTKAMRHLAIALIGLMQVVSIPVAGYRLEHQLSVAKQYCESLLPEIERYRQEQGTCPESLQALSGHHPPPDFLRGQEIYRAYNVEQENEQPCEYYFRFHLPGGAPLTSYAYSSTSSAWTIED